jgi:hypothetical protein
VAVRCHRLKETETRRGRCLLAAGRTRLCLLALVLQLVASSASGQVNGSPQAEGWRRFKCQQYNQALSLWGRLKAVDPEDWQVRAKLIQTYQSLESYRSATQNEVHFSSFASTTQTGGLPKKLNTAASNLKLAVKGSWYLNILN